MTPPIPEAGLVYVLSAWSGSGQLLEALAAIPSDDPVERRWTARDVGRRANRVLFASMVSSIGRLPITARRWRDALPAESTVESTTSPYLGSRMDVIAMRRRGWPPQEFVVRRRGRVAEEILARTAAWTIGRIVEIAADAQSVDPTIGRGVESQMLSMAAAIEAAPLRDAPPERPDRRTLAAVRRAGPPWTSIASLASIIVTADKHLDVFSRQLIEPDENLRWRLFHLGVLGEVLLALIDEGGRVQSLRPLSSASAGANYIAVWPAGQQVEVWFEAAGVWRMTRRTSPYVTAATGLADAGVRPLGPDLLLICDDRVLVIECKYSTDSRYVATGYEQVLAYAAELRGPIASEVEAVVVGPHGTVRSTGLGETGIGPVRIMPASSLRTAVMAWLGIEAGRARADGHTSPVTSG